MPNRVSNLVLRFFATLRMTMERRFGYAGRIFRLWLPSRKLLVLLASFASWWLRKVHRKTASWKHGR